MRARLSTLLPCVFAVTSLLCTAAGVRAVEPRLLWEIGKRDNASAEFALAPQEASQFPKQFSVEPVFTVGASDAKRDWPFVHPGPADVWAGSKSHTFTVIFGLKSVAAQGSCRLKVELADVHPEHRPQLRVHVNGRELLVTLEKRATPKPHPAAFTKDSCYGFVLSIPSSLLQVGNNAVTITTLSGSWMIYDWLGLEAPEGLELADVAPSAIITEVTGSVLFPRPAKGEPLRQTTRMRLCNLGQAARMKLMVKVGDRRMGSEDLGLIEHGPCTRSIHMPDLEQPAEATFELEAEGRPAGSLRLPWQPARKWTVYCVSFSHHDLGYGNYPHRLRTDIRHANIERPLGFCRETDGWDEDSKFRFVIETSEPITSYLGSHSLGDAAELARRLREGRIQLGGMHNTANTEQLSTECLARLFYLSGRHTPDLLGVKPGKTAIIDDVVGLTWPLATFCAEADVPWFFHGYNLTAPNFKPASKDPIFRWQGPDGRGQVLVRSFPYGGYGGDSIGDGSEAQIEKVLGDLAATGYAYDVAMCQDGTDFQLVTMDNARKIRAWNAKYQYPRLICATMDMFFEAMLARMGPERVKTFAKDANNLWADQDANDAWLLGQARRQGEGIPTTEKFSTIAGVLTAGGYPWSDVYQAYHRLLAYHEHTNGAELGVGAQGTAGAQHYETELVENREMVQEAQTFSQRALKDALERLTAAISTDAERTVIVFNPLNWARTDLVRVSVKELKPPLRLMDSAGKDVPWQSMTDGAVGFVARDVPSVGYKTFKVLSGESRRPGPTSAPTREPCLENRFYRIRFDPQTGSITSLYDKQLKVELVDGSAAHQFNQYLYEYYDSPAYDRVQWQRPRGASLSVSAGPVAKTMRVVASAPGCEQFEQQVTIYNDLNRVDFTMSLVKSPSGRTLVDYLRATAKGKEAVYAAFPLAVSEFQARHDTAAGVLEPITQQFAGSCTAFYAVRHFADLSNEKYGVTLATVEAPLVEYDHPRSCAYAKGERDYESVLKSPERSHLYLYLMNNMFDTNVRIDQRGPVRFTWSIRSHEGDWRRGKAPQFGWEVSNPLLARVTEGRRRATLPADQHSFMSIDKPNVVCTTIKPAEANAPGLILRFCETEGRETTASVSLPFFGHLASAVETSLVENNRPGPLRVSGSQVAFTVPPFGVKTLRILRKSDEPLAAVADLSTTPVADMEVRLQWRLHEGGPVISHYNIYRGPSPEFTPTLLHLVGRTAEASWIDRPQLNHGGWINNRLEPETAYYYRVSAVDRWNNEGPSSPAVRTTTLKSTEKNAVPLRVEGLRAILVSEVSPENYLNLLWRTNCESDVVRYHVYRGDRAGFTTDASNRIAVVDANAIVKGSTAYGHTPIDRRLGEFDHQMYQDTAVRPGAVYYYRVCAVDKAGQEGPPSEEASGRTKPAAP